VGAPTEFFLSDVQQRELNNLTWNPHPTLTKFCLFQQWEMGNACKIFALGLVPDLRSLV